MRAPRIALPLLLLLLTTGCTVRNPPAPGFDTAGSDPAAVALADDVMERMGGRRAWDETRCIEFSFFGSRRHVWDKHTGDVRIEGKDRETGAPYVIIMNVNTGAGRAMADDREVTDPARLAEMLEGGKRAWINDTYWLVMPYKLKDTGVTLRHLGVRDMEDDRAADVLELTFADVGVTPQNKYHVYVAHDSGLVEQWDFYAKSDDAEPRFRIPWHDWHPYGGILLSGNRGERSLSDIAVRDAVSPSTFHAF